MMTNDFLAMFNGTGQASYSNFQELGAINMKAVQKLTELQLNLLTLGLESSAEQAKILMDSDNYENLLAIETGIATEYGNKWLGITQGISEILSESSQEYVDWAGKCFTAVTQPEAPKPATRTATTATTTSKKKRSVTKKAA